jgi:hypothetical protein
MSGRRIGIVGELEILSQLAVFAAPWGPEADSAIQAVNLHKTFESLRGLPVGFSPGFSGVIGRGRWVLEPSSLGRAILVGYGYARHPAVALRSIGLCRVADHVRRRRPVADGGEGSCQFPV